MAGYILWKNHADTATLSTTTGGVMARPLTQLQIPWGRGLMRGPTNNVGGAAVLVIRADLGESKRIHGIGLLGTNGVTQVVGNVYLSAVSAGSSEAGSYDLLWDDGWETPHSQGVWAFPGNGSAGAVATARYVQISLEVYGRDIAERYVDARRLLIMEGTALPDGFNSDWSMLPVDMSTGEATPKGGVFVNSQSGYRTLTFGVAGMTKAEAKTNTVAVDTTDSLQRTLTSAGRNKEVVVCPRYYDDSADPELFYNTVYGRLQSWSPIQHSGGDHYECSQIVVDEIPHPPLS